MFNVRHRYKTIYFRAETEQQFIAALKEHYKNAHELPEYPFQESNDVLRIQPDSIATTLSHLEIDRCTNFLSETTFQQALFFQKLTDIGITALQFDYTDQSRKEMIRSQTENGALIATNLNSLLALNYRHNGSFSKALQTICVNIKWVDKIIKCKTQVLCDRNKEIFIDRKKLFLQILHGIIHDIKANNAPDIANHLIQSEISSLMQSLTEDEQAEFTVYQEDRSEKRDDSIEIVEKCHADNKKEKDDDILKKTDQVLDAIEIFLTQPHLADTKMEIIWMITNIMDTIWKYIEIKKHYQLTKKLFSRLTSIKDMATSLMIPLSNNLNLSYQLLSEKIDFLEHARKEAQRKQEEAIKKTIQVKNEIAQRKNDIDSLLSKKKKLTVEDFDKAERTFQSITTLLDENEHILQLSDSELASCTDLLQKIRCKKIEFYLKRINKKTSSLQNKYKSIQRTANLEQLPKLLSFISNTDKRMIESKQIKEDALEYLNSQEHRELQCKILSTYTAINALYVTATEKAYELIDELIRETELIEKDFFAIEALLKLERSDLRIQAIKEQYSHLKIKIEKYNALLIKIELNTLSIPYQLLEKLKQFNKIETTNIDHEVTMLQIEQTIKSEVTTIIERLNMIDTELPTIASYRALNNLNHTIHNIEELVRNTSPDYPSTLSEQINRLKNYKSRIEILETQWKNLIKMHNESLSKDCRTILVELNNPITEETVSISESILKNIALQLRKYEKESRLYFFPFVIEQCQNIKEKIKTAKKLLEIEQKKNQIHSLQTQAVKFIQSVKNSGVLKKEPLYSQSQYFIDQLDYYNPDVESDRHNLLLYIACNKPLIDIEWNYFELKQEIQKLFSFTVMDSQLIVRMHQKISQHIEIIKKLLNQIDLKNSTWAQKIEHDRECSLNCVSI